MRTAFEDGLTTYAAYQVPTTVSGRYSYKLDTNTRPLLPTWYSGNIPDLLYLKTDGTRYLSEVYSDVYNTAEFISAIDHLYQVTGDLAFVSSHVTALEKALGALQRFDQAYDSQYGEDDNLFPNVLMPMSDLGQIAGEYPGESAQIIYAYESAARLLRVLDRAAEADQLQDDFITPMKAAFDAYFWDAAQNFYLPVADQRSQTTTPGTRYQDLWAHNVFIPLKGDLGQNHLAQMLSVLTGSSFWEPQNDVHWLAKGSQNFAADGRWGLPTGYTNGWGMEGGYLVLPNAIAALGYYQLDQAQTARRIRISSWINGCSTGRRRRRWSITGRCPANSANRPSTAKPSLPFPGCCSPPSICRWTAPR